MLVSSITFKLSLEATAAGHVRRALGCWGRISSAGSRDREGGRARDSPARGDWEPGRAEPKARRPGARPSWNCEDCARKGSTWEPGLCESGERKPPPQSLCQVKSGWGVVV
jgi:hypothetical protein